MARNINGRSSNERQIWPRLLLGAIAIAAIGVLYFVEPTQASWLPKCMLHQWTGLHCPGCGATRAVHALLHGRIVEAMQLNPLLVVGGPVLLIAIWFRSRNDGAGDRSMPASGWLLLLALLVVYFVARNVPSPSSSPFAPPTLTVFEESPAGKQVDRLGLENVSLCQSREV